VEYGEAKTTATARATATAKATARTKETARTKTNAGILHCVQDDDVNCSG
jgi:hypothetical protein